VNGGKTKTKWALDRGRLAKKTASHGVSKDRKRFWEAFGTAGGNNTAILAKGTLSLSKEGLTKKGVERR